MTRAAVAAALLVPVFASACASVPRDAGFGEVRGEVARRNGGSVEWNPSPDERAVTERVQALLKDDLTADRAVEIALFNNRGLQGTLAELGIARADLMQAGLLKNPLLGGEIRFPKSVVAPFEITIVQSLLDLIQLPLRKRVAAAAFAQAQARIGGAVLDLAAEARAGVFSVQAAEQAAALRRTITEAARSSAELARRQHAAGNITDLDLDNQQALFEQAKLEQARSEADVIRDREWLNQLLGLWGPETRWTVASVLPDPPKDEVTLQGLESLAIDQRLDIVAARAEVEQAARARPLARLGVLDALGVGLHRERDAEGATTTGPVAELSLPVFNRGGAAARRAFFQLRQSQARLTALAVQARSEVRTSYASEATARKTYEYFQAVLLPRRDRIVKQTQLEYNSMLTGVFQLLLARQNQIDAQRQSIEALRDYWLARTALEKAVGGRLVLESHVAGHESSTVQPPDGGR